MIKYVTLPILKKFIIDEDVDLKVGCCKFMPKVVPKFNPAVNIFTMKRPWIQLSRLTICENRGFNLYFGIKFEKSDRWLPIY